MSATSQGVILSFFLCFFSPLLLLLLPPLPAAAAPLASLIVLGSSGCKSGVFDDLGEWLCVSPALILLLEVVDAEVRFLTI
jgi:hypothetical protein